MQLLRDSRGGTLVVAGQQHRLHALCRQPVDHRGALFAHRVRQHHKPGERRSHRYIHHGAALCQMLLHLRFHRRRNNNAVVGQHRAVARQHRRALHLCHHAAPRQHGKRLGGIQRAADLLPVATHHRFAQRVLRHLLRRGAQSIHLIV